jgi:drug/metabolite transporter (DMT)-like permease
MTTAVAVLTVVALHDVLPSVVSSALYALLVIGASLSAKALSARRRRSRRADDPNSIEREHELRAAAGTLPVSILSLLILGAWLIMSDALGPASLVYAAVVVTIAAYWINYARVRRQS